MESLNKLILNNKIVDMRHSVKQSRIQSINKLVKEIKKLREKKGTDEQKAKNQSKAERHVECIQIMKKLKEDDVSKFALMNEKSLAQITNNVNASPEMKAIARIADHRPIYNKVKEFREKYPDWKEALPLLFDTLGERYQEKKIKKNTAKSKTKTAESKKQTSSKTNNNKTSSITYIHNKLGTWRVEEIVPLTENHKCDNKLVLSNSKSEDEIHINETSDEVDLPEENDDFVQISNTKDNRKNEANKFCQDLAEHTKKIEKLKENKRHKASINIHTYEKNKKENDYEIVEQKSSKKVSKEKDISMDDGSVTKTVDPFFVTKDNKEYLSVSVVSNTLNSEEKKADFPSKKLKNEYFESKTYETNWKQNKTKAEVPKKYSKIETKEENLHPSWEAKRKLTSISKFQGKKIKFED